MTDKVQKIKEWIGKEQDGLMEANGNFEYPEHEGAYHILCNLDTYIDSLQEEPKFKTGDRIKPIDSCLGSPRTIVDVCDSWYVTDQGTLDFEYEDNWELAEEHKKCMYSKDNYTNEDRKALCDGCEEECKYAQKEEPVSDDLEEASEKCIKELIPEAELNSATLFALEYVVKLLHETFKAGAKWQIRQMRRGAFIAGAKSIEFKLGENITIKPNEYDVKKAMAYNVKEGDKIICYFMKLEN